MRLSENKPEYSKKPQKRTGIRIDPDKHQMFGEYKTDKKTGLKKVNGRPRGHASALSGSFESALIGARIPRVDVEYLDKLHPVRSHAIMIVIEFYRQSHSIDKEATAQSKK